MSKILENSLGFLDQTQISSWRVCSSEELYRSQLF